MTWTDDRVATLRDLWDAGYSAARIAMELRTGVSRNAVIGKIHRLNLAARNKTTIINARAPRPSRAVPGALRPGRPKAMAREDIIYSPPVTPVQRATPEDALAAPGSLMIEIGELKSMTCRWPHGDSREDSFRYCGAACPVEVPYCAQHMRAAYVATPARRRAKYDDRKRNF